MDIGWLQLFGYYYDAAVNIRVQVFVWTYIFILWGTHLGMELLGLRKLCLPFGNRQAAFPRATPFPIPTSSVRGSRLFRFFAHSCYHLLSIAVIPVGVKWYLAVTASF